MSTQAENMRALRLGAAEVAIVNVGELRGDVVEWMGRPAEHWPPEYAADARGPFSVPVNCVHIALGDASVLVDASLHDIAPASPFALPGYRPPAPLLDCLAQRHVQPAEVTAVVLTHSHNDHINGATALREGRIEPLFPRARYYLGRGDWEQPELQVALRDPDSLASRTLGVLWERGLLELVDGDRELAPGLRIIVAPGETPGHLIVRLHSDGHTLYCLGDLYHHCVEVGRPDWSVTWADPATMPRSKAALVEAALRDDALLVATHIRSIGRLRRSSGGVTWAAEAL